MKKIDVCPGTLASGFDRYSPVCVRSMFDGVAVNHVLDFSYDAENSDFVAAVNRISISGVQEKLSVVVKDKKLQLAAEGESGRYIIKPAPDYKHLRYRDQVPANEHLTMQIARQVYKMKTADNAMAFFADGKPAYITKRFDYTGDGQKIAQEDFSSLAGKTTDTHGKNFKYTGSYEDAAALIKANVAAWRVEMANFFALVVFNYLFGNGDAHLKNFSIQETPSGDYVMTPCYDLLNTSIHIDDGDFALQDGLMPREVHSEVYRNTGHPCKADFVEFGHRIELLPKKINEIIARFATEQPLVYELIERSFLDERAKRMYKRSYQERLHRFQRDEK
ncbi:MAG: HipA domain-containing protein [Muribaculaceae bacterium]|nr:HipA domain-containing protein [Muribaculaceae bacterium]